MMGEVLAAGQYTPGYHGLLCRMIEWIDRQMNHPPMVPQWCLCLPYKLWIKCQQFHTKSADRDNARRPLKNRLRRLWIQHRQRIPRRLFRHPDIG